MKQISGIRPHGDLTTGEHAMNSAKDEQHLSGPPLTNQHGSSAKVSYHSQAISKAASSSISGGARLPSSWAPAPPISLGLGPSPSRPPYASPFTAVISDGLQDIPAVTSDLGYAPPLHGKPATVTPVKPSVSHSSQLSLHTAAAPAQPGAAAVTSNQPPGSAGPTPKRRGRPVGWRAGMGPYSGKANFPGGPTAKTKSKAPGEAKRRGRPARDGPSAIRFIYDKLKPKWVAFRCEWEGCPAELQNFQTLRKHVLVVHGGEEECRWGRCAGGMDGAAVRLATAAEFESHVDKAHLKSFLWHIGDGPENDQDARARLVADTDSKGTKFLPLFLCDAQGNQVTPSIRDQVIENDEERKQRQRRLHRLWEQREKNAPEEEELTDAELSPARKHE